MADAEEHVVLRAFSGEVQLHGFFVPLFAGIVTRVQGKAHFVPRNPTSESVQLASPGEHGRWVQFSEPLVSLEAHASFLRWLRRSRGRCL